MHCFTVWNCLKNNNFFLFSSSRAENNQEKFWKTSVSNMKPDTAILIN